MMTSISEQLQKLRMRLNQENENSVNAVQHTSHSTHTSQSLQSSHTHSNTSNTSYRNRNTNQIQQQQQQQQTPQPQPSLPESQYYNNSNRHLPNNSNYPQLPQRQYSLSATQRQPNNSNLQLNLAQVSNRNNSNREIGSLSQSTSLINAQCLSPRPRPRQLMIGSDCQARPGSPSRAVKPNNLLFPPNSNSTGNTFAHLRNNNTGDDYRMNEFQQNNSVLTIDGKKYSAQDVDLEYLDELGSGSCGHVVKMRHIPSGKVVAVKQMRRSGNKEENKRITMDLDILLACHDCPNIVQCYGYFIKDTEVWICMELMTTCFDKLLKKLKSSIPENILGKISVATVKALNYLKDNHGVIHRDVKPSNILINEKGVVKLCDFGISGRLVDSKAKTRSAGCAAYMAPERIDPPDTSNPSYDIRADVWSLGITLVELATGKFPYHECKTDFEVLTKVIQDDPPSLPPNGMFSMDFCSFVKQCLTKDYRKRPKYKKLLDHAFLKRYEKANINVEQWFHNVMQTENFAESPDLSPYTNN